MNKQGHTYGAIMFAPLPAMSIGQISAPMGLVAAIACISAGNLPDRLEFGLIPHRTITHTLSLWFAMGLYGYHLTVDPTLTPFYEIKSYHEALGAILCGFGAGGVSHWIGDVLNKQPVPVFTPFDSFALYLFNSGDHQRFTCGLIALKAWLLTLLLRPESFLMNLLSSL